MRVLTQFGNTLKFQLEVHYKSLVLVCKASEFSLGHHLSIRGWGPVGLCAGGESASPFISPSAIPPAPVLV